MRRKTKLTIGAIAFSYFLLVVTVSLALLSPDQNNEQTPRIDEISQAKNTLGIPGLKIKGSGLDGSFRALLIPDTISSERLLASSIDHGHMYDIVAAGDYLFVASASRGLEVYSRQQKANLAAEAHLDLGGRAIALKLMGRYLYVLLTKPASLLKISIADPLKPEIVKRLELSGRPVALEKHRESLYVANYSNGLWQISKNLEIVNSNEKYAGLEQAWKLTSNGTYLFVGGFDGRLWRLGPQKDSTELIRVKDFQRLFRGLAAGKGGLFVQLKGGVIESFTLGQDGRLSNRKSIDTPSHVHASGISLHQDGKLLIALESSTGAHLYAVQSQGDLLSQGAIVDNGTFSAVSVVGDALYTTSTRGLDVWSLKNLPIIDDKTLTRTWPGTFYQIEKWKQYFFADGNHTGINIFKLGESGLFQTIKPLKEIDHITVSGDHLWATNKEFQLESYHLGDDGRFVPCQEINLPRKGILSIHARENGLLGVVRDKGVTAYSITSDCSAEELFFLPISGKVSDVLFEDKSVYVSLTNTKEILVYSWNKPDWPRLVSKYHMPMPLKELSRPRNLAKYGDKLFVSMGRVGLLGLDVSDASSIKQFFFFDTPGYSGRMHVVDDILYLADSFSGFWLLDISGVKSDGFPKVIGNYAGAMDPLDMVFTDEEMYVAGGLKGLTVLRVPHFYRTQQAFGDEAFIPLGETEGAGRYRFLGYNEAGHLGRGRLIEIAQN